MDPFGLMSGNKIVSKVSGGAGGLNGVDASAPCPSNDSSDSLSQTPKVWRPASRMTNEDACDVVYRQLKGNLNKLTIEKFETLAEKIATQCESLPSYGQLENAVALIIDRAVLEPDWSEMYADLCQILLWRCRDYNVQGRVLSFSTALLTKIQHEYEKTRVSEPVNDNANGTQAATDDLDELETARRKTKVLGTVKMIGELFQRKMLGFKIVSKVVKDLVSTQVPSEHLIECFVQLVYSTGYFIDSNPTLRPVLDMWFGRLKELVAMPQYSKRIRCIMQNVLDLPKAQWRKKIHKDTAKALTDLREQVSNEDILGGSALAAQFGNIVVVGQRNNIHAKCAYGDYIKRQEQMYLNKKATANNNSSHLT